MDEIPFNLDGIHQMKPRLLCNLHSGLTESQLEAREHRVSYMVQDGDVSEEAAHAHCDSFSTEYGFRELRKRRLEL